MRLALVHPYPVSSRAVGGTTRLYAMVRHLAGRHEVHVLTHAHGEPDAEAEAIRELAELGVRQQVFPRPAHGWAEKARWALRPEPYFVLHNRNPALEQALAELDRERGLDVVHLELGYLEPLLHGVGPRCARTLAEQELMSLNVERLRAVPFRHKSPYQHYISLELPRIRRFETTAFRRLDRLFGITEGEATRLSELSGRPVGVLPHVVDTRAFTPPAAPGSTDGREVLFVGNYGHHPNVEAAFWLLERVWPAVRRVLPDARVTLVGPGLAPGQRETLARLGASLPGRVEDLPASYQRAAVFANPIRSGGGMRGKVLEACACGVPVVSTAMGLEGVAGTPGRDWVRADAPEAFAEALLRLMRDPDERGAIGRSARRLVETRYDTRVVMGRLEHELLDASAERRGGARGAMA